MKTSVSSLQKTEFVFFRYENESNTMFRIDLCRCGWTPATIDCTNEEFILLRHFRSTNLVYAATAAVENTTRVALKMMPMIS